MKKEYEDKVLSLLAKEEAIEALEVFVFNSSNIEFLKLTINTLKNTKYKVYRKYCEMLNQALGLLQDGEQSKAQGIILNFNNVALSYAIQVLHESIVSNFKGMDNYRHGPSAIMVLVISDCHDYVFLKKGSTPDRSDYDEKVNTKIKEKLSRILLDTLETKSRVLELLNF